MEPILKENYMKIIGKKEGESYVFYENQRKIYTMTSKVKNGLIKVILNNQLNHTVFEVFQLMSWKNYFRKNKYDFAVYSDDQKVAELSYTKTGYEVEHYGTYKHFEEGMEQETPCIYVKQKDKVEATYRFEQDIVLELNQLHNHALHICFAYLFYQYLK